MTERGHLNQKELKRFKKMLEDSKHGHLGQRAQDDADGRVKLRHR